MTEKKKAKVGRPKTPRRLAKRSLLSVRLSDDEHKALTRAAGKTGVKLSQWARSKLLEAIEASS